jgi:hypothetical protein
MDLAPVLGRGSLATDRSTIREGASAGDGLKDRQEVDSIASAGRTADNGKLSRFLPSISTPFSGLWKVCSKSYPGTSFPWSARRARRAGGCATAAKAASLCIARCLPPVDCSAMSSHSICVLVCAELGAHSFAQWSDSVARSRFACGPGGFGRRWAVRSRSVSSKQPGRSSWTICCQLGRGRGRRARHRRCTSQGRAQRGQEATPVVQLWRATRLRRKHGWCVSQLHLLWLLAGQVTCAGPVL